MKIKSIDSSFGLNLGESDYFGGVCENPNARYAVAGQCDAYIQCKDGVANETLCFDGLLFDEEAGPKEFPCKYPIEVQCKARGALQPAQPTERCPHQFGYFHLGDPTNCRTYLSCAHGVGTIMKCPIGLAFDETSNQCDWPENVKNCDVEAYLGFRCPYATEELYRTNNCKYFLSCTIGRPRLNACSSGHAFSEELKECTQIENVPGCEYLLNANPNDDGPDFRLDVRLQ